MDTKSSELETYKKRVELLVGARYKKSEKISSAANSQDQIRKKVGKWEGSEVIAKWRQR